MTRRELRESIFKALFRIEFNDKDEWEEQLNFYIEELEHPTEAITPEETDEEKEEESAIAALDVAYIVQKVKHIFDCIDEIDAVISERTEGWNINRIGKTELAILRLAVYEMNYDEDVPEKVAINEAVELAKIYCADEAKGFVNAVLAKMTKE